MARHHRRPRIHHGKKRLPLWKAVSRYGLSNALRYEFRHPRRYPRYPIWFIPMLISMVIIAIVLFYCQIEHVPIIFYILEIIAVSYMMYRLLKRLNRIRIKGSLLRLWGLKILSAVVSIIGILIIYFVLISIFLVPFEMLLNQESIIIQFVTFGQEFQTPFIIPLLLEVIGIGLCLIGAYLLFKFKMRSGQVIWVGRI